MPQQAAPSWLTLHVNVTILVLLKGGILLAVASRYAIALHILTWIARMTLEKDEFVPSERIAASVNTSPVFIRRILGLLAKANLVTVRHGGTGAGWKLAGNPADITLRDVYEAVSPTPLFELHHSSPNDNCLIGRGIQPALRPIFNQSEEALKQQLSQVTIEKLLQDTLVYSGG